MMIIRRVTITSLIILAGIFSFGTASAQQADVMLQHYGAQPGDHARAYSAPSRDRQGTRLVVNGRMINIDDNSAQPNSNAATFSPGLSSNGPTLGRSTLNAVSIGNSIELNGIRNSTINITQRNYGTQSAVIQGTN